MRRVKHGVILTFVLVMVVVTLGSCGNKSGKLSTILVTPSQTMIARGSSQQFNATAIFSDGAMITWTSAATWSSSDGSAVTMSNNFGTYGVASSLATGTTRTVTITATDSVNHISGSVQMIVADPLSIMVVPANPIMAAGTTHQFTATGILADLASGASSTVSAGLTSLPTISWSSNDESIAQVGTKGLVTALAPGSATIMAQDLVTGVSGTTLVTVIDFQLNQLVVTSATFTINLGSSTQLTAEGTLASNPTSTYDYTEAVTWSSTDTAIAEVSNTTGLKGLITAGTRTGTTTIKAVDPITNHYGTMLLRVE